MRGGPSAEELRKTIILTLNNKHGYTFLDINRLIKEEVNRKTAIGYEMSLSEAAGKPIPMNLTV